MPGEGRFNYKYIYIFLEILRNFIYIFFLVVIVKRKLVKCKKYVWLNRYDIDFLKIYF